MARRDSSWLTTGQAARLCSVTPDTVLKWIRKGRIGAVRTAGGHYRIDRQEIAPFIRRSRDGEELAADVPDARQQPMRCWEYFSEGEGVSDDCKKCVVYQVRASRCFRVANMEQDVGHSRRFCTRSCDECVYFRRAKGLPTNVLVVTPDKTLLSRLKGEKDKGVTLRVARNDYEASAAIQTFRPAFAVVDRELCTEGEGGLLESLASDPRASGLRIILGIPKGGGVSTNGVRKKLVSAMLEKPFGLKEILAVIESFPIEQVNGDGEAHGPDSSQD